MPPAEVVFFADPDGAVPILRWFDELERRDRRILAKVLARLERLHDLGHELRRPEADLLRDGIYELRLAFQGVQYRALYFFAGRLCAVISHGLAKEDSVPPREIDLAVGRKNLFLSDPEKYTYREVLDEEETVGDAFERLDP